MMLAGVVRFGGRPMMQGIVDVFDGGWPTDPLRQQRAQEHADEGHAQADQLRRHQTFLTDQQLDQQPCAQPTQDGRQCAAGCAPAAKQS